MRNLALSVAAILVLAVASPAFAQPFADVPTDHWAFDAIAELAAKGIIEGFPDGTFKGDRGVTRYEVSMIVARILARIEAIKMPAPVAAAPTPQVTRADVQTIQRLVNEFRAELAALGVRVTAVEEELSALKMAADTTKISGSASIYYFVDTVPGGTIPEIYNDDLLTFTGTSGPWTVVTRLNFAALSGGGDGTSLWGAGSPVVEGTSFDLAYVDWSAGPWGSKWRAGRQRYTLGARGLLFNTTETSSDSFDGVKTDWAFGPVALTLGTFYDNVDPDGVGPLPVNAQDIWVLSAGFNLLPGWTTKAHYMMERPWNGSASNNGWQVDFAGNLLGLPLTAAYATYTPTGGASSSAYFVGTTFNLGSMMGMGNLTLELAYNDYGSSAGCVPGTSCPQYSNAETRFNGVGTWNIQTSYARLDLELSSSIAPYLAYETGSQKSSGTSLVDTTVGFVYQLGGGASVDVYWSKRDAGAPLGNDEYYEADFSVSW